MYISIHAQVVRMLRIPDCTMVKATVVIASIDLVRGGNPLTSTVMQ